MQSTYPPEIKQFIQQELNSGQFADEHAVITAALEVYRELKQRHHELKDRIQLSLEQAGRGETAPLDINSRVAELQDEADQAGPHA